MRKKNFKRVIALILCFTLVGMNMSTILYAAVNEKFNTSAYANHWGRSDLRAYLNGVEKTDSTLLVNTTHTNRASSGYYESQFSDEEYGLVQPHTYNTNILDTLGNVIGTYETTDKFWLPSGNYSNDKVISWDNNDINSNSQSVSKDKVIPISYWSNSNSNSWLRSGYNVNNTYSLATNRGTSVLSQVVNSQLYISPMFKIDTSSINFASAASAETIVSSTGDSGAKKIDIEGSRNFGTETSNFLPDYGMYLKTTSNDSFSPTELVYSSTEEKLKVTYSNGVEGRYVMVQAYMEDNLQVGTTSYVAAGKLQSEQTEVSIDVSDWRITSLAGYTIKVWMEDVSTDASLAKATEPETFIGNESSITKSNTNEASNARVFAKKSDLQTSWGTLSNATEAVGSNPTNQKIYYGKDSSGNPMQFWIAGRENNNGEIDVNGDIMYLYQAKAIEQKQFNNSIESYKEDAWINSDIRKFMNTGAAGGRADSTTDENQSVNSSGYASHFTKEEYGIIKPSKVTTTNNNRITVDRFVLPSGRYTNSINVLSWGQDDISIKENVEDKDKRYLIPLSYWAGGVSDGAWIRSASEESDKAFIAERCKSLTSTKVDSEQYVAPFFRIDISDVHFASMVSASDLLNEQPSTNNITKELKIEESSNLGKIDSTNSTVPSYGMYLKTKLESNFKVTRIGIMEKKLQLHYEYGDIGKAIVVQMHTSDYIEGENTIFMAVSKITAVNVESNPLEIDIKEWGDGIKKLRDYTIKVWMEDLSTGASLAKATEPQTFACSEGSEWNEVVGDTEIDKLPKNTRAFAMKNELKCSWGDLSKCFDNAVIAGKNNASDYKEQDGNRDTFCKGRNVGVFATNQKIYYGTYDNGNPIEFWIAGRETRKVNDSGSYGYTIATDDEIKNNSSNIMCLYQTSAIDNDKRAFKDNTNSNKYQPKLSIEGIGNNYTCADIGTNMTLTVLQNSNVVTESCKFISSNPYVATVDDTGKVTLNNPGTFEIIAIKDGENGTYQETVRTEPITMSHNLTSYSEDTIYGTHYVKCNVEGCGATFLAHDPDYEIDNNTKKHKCSVIATNNGKEITCNLKHDAKYLEDKYSSDTKHKCAHEGCGLEHLMNYQNSSDNTHKCNGSDTSSNNDGGDCNLNHTIDYKYVDDDYHRCAGCNIQEKHNYGNGENGNNDDVWEVVEMSTPTKKGKKKKVCIGCGHEVIEDIPCIGQDGLGDMLLDDENNDFNASIANEDEVKENIEISEDEFNKILDGKSIKIILKVLNLTAKVDTPEKEAIEKALNGYKIGTFLDIDLSKILDGVETEIEKTKGLISIKFLVPDELINKDNGVVRTYKMFRYHDGKVEALDTTYDSKTNMITFKTDRFSTYALTYSDKEITNSGESAGKGEASKTDKDGEGSGDSSTEKDSGEKSDIKDKNNDKGNAINKHDKTPDTGDKNNVYVYAFMLIMSMGIIIKQIAKKKVK